MVYEIIVLIFRLKQCLHGYQAKFTIYTFLLQLGI